MKLLAWEVTGISDILIISLLCIVIVFAVLIIIALLLGLLNKVRALDVKEEIFLKDGTKVDDDMLAAILVATIDYRKERKEDVKVISCKLIEDERMK